MAIGTGGTAAGNAGQVLLECRDTVAYVTLSHPGRLNAITVSMWRQLTDTFTQLAADTSLRCVVVQGQGGDFAAGADIREFPAYRSTTHDVIHYHTRILAPALQAVAACVHPVVARIQGVCVGGGLEIASQCDFRIAARSARFGVPINRLGFPMAPHEMQGLLALAGPAVTLEILLEGRVFDAPEAYEKGLLTRFVDDDRLDHDVDHLVQRLVRGAPLAARINKETVRRLMSDSRPLRDAELNTFFRYAQTHDHREGVDAFLADRAPLFTGD